MADVWEENEGGKATGNVVVYYGDGSITLVGHEAEEAKRIVAKLVGERSRSVRVSGPLADPD